VLFDLIFLGLFLLGWLLCAYVPWVTLSIATKGNAGMVLLPLCLFTGVVAAMAVPVMGFDGPNGLKASFVAAFLGSAAMLGIGRFARQGAGQEHFEAHDMTTTETPERSSTAAGRRH